MATARYIVKDVEESVAFYSTPLGFEVVQNFAPATAILQRDDLQLWIAGPAASASRPMLDGAIPEPGGWNRFVIIVEDLEKPGAGLRSQGVRFRNDIEINADRKQILCEDPSGNVIELFQSG